MHNNKALLIKLKGERSKTIKIIILGGFNNEKKQ